MNEMVVVVYCSLSESGLSTYSKISALLADVTVSNVALDSLQQHSMELVVEAAVMPLSLVQDMIREWMEMMVKEVDVKVINIVTTRKVFSLLNNSTITLY